MAKQAGTMVGTVIAPNEIRRLRDYCDKEGMTVSSAVRDAVTFYLNAQEGETVSQTERALEQRMRALENRTATLLAKMGRAVAQNMYFTMAPFIAGGLPEKPLSQKAMDAMWQKASQFAGMWMKRARTEDESELIKQQFNHGNDDIEVEG